MNLIDKTVYQWDFDFGSVPRSIERLCQLHYALKVMIPCVVMLFLLYSYLSGPVYIYVLVHSPFLDIFMSHLGIFLIACAFPFVALLEAYCIIYLRYPEQYKDIYAQAAANPIRLCDKMPLLMTLSRYS